MAEKEEEERQQKNMPPKETPKPQGTSVPAANVPAANVPAPNVPGQAGQNAGPRRFEEKSMKGGQPEKEHTEETTD
ncbi:MAG: hypothetical protein ACYDDF_11755 [Thermoplasmatota archaeon]